MTSLDRLAAQVLDARGTLRIRIDALSEALAVIRKEARAGEPLSIRWVQVKLAAVEEAQEILRACETAARRAAALMRTM